MDRETKIKNREFYNSLLSYIISLQLKLHPDLRFIQALWSLRIIDVSNDNIIIDRFYEEPYDTLKRIKSKVSEVLQTAVIRDVIDEEFDTKYHQLRDLNII